MVHTVKGFGKINKGEIDVFLELSSFLDDPVDVGNLISGSSAFSKTSLNIWKFTVHILLKPGLENFENYFTSVWYELVESFKRINAFMFIQKNHMALYADCVNRKQSMHIKIKMSFYQKEAILVSNK